MAEFGDIIRDFRDGSTNRVRVILLCFLAATTFWFLNALNKEHTATIRYPLEFLYDQSTYVSVEELPEDVLINVNSIGWNLLKNSLGIKVSPLQIPIDNPVDTRKIAANTLPALISEQLNDFQLNYVLTDTLHLHIDRKLRNTVYLKVDTSRIVLAENTRIRSKVNITPDSVVLEGAASMIQALNDTIVINLDSDQINSDFDEIVGIDLPPGVAALNTNAVRISFQITEYVERSIRVPIQRQNFPDDSSWIAEPSEVLVRYRVDAEDDVDVNPSAFRIVADFNRMNQSDSLISPRIAAFPERLSGVRMDSLMVRIQHKK
ncbi:hypothetical protein [Fulvivirga sedimenti]|uniref:YbbR-like domain-containing protein n=1 Tax=Fulvivirga sedimenti TaxID=2879465 RepID=A0A9X1KZ90_9BACT|nr:hypothetical protein [Fulvivirga sedimenti]MCA6078663.1 hypothetical protein [Fulvivirga sedimenti]